MKVLSVDGLPPVAGVSVPKPQRYVDLEGRGRVIHVEALPSSFGKGPVKASLWILGGLYALFGALIVLRRPDLRAARIGGLFTGSTAVALAVAPSSGGPGPGWAIIVQMLSMLIIGATLALFVFTLVSTGKERLKLLFQMPLAVTGVAIAGAFGVSVFHSPLYAAVRASAFAYVAVCFLLAIIRLMTYATFRTDNERTQQARVCLAGVALGTLPFASLTLLPGALGRPSLLPEYVTVMPVALLPASFVYAILQYQLLGIRKLVHRGIVYGVTSLALLLLVFWGLAIGLRLTHEEPKGGAPLLATAATLALGIVAFVPLRRGARWLVDKLLYQDIAGYQALLDVVGDELLTASHTGEVASLITRRLARMLHLESALMFLGAEADRSGLVAEAGDRARETLPGVEARLDELYLKSAGRDTFQLPWESEALLLAPLRASGRRLGLLVLGPKKGGEVFVEEEQSLIASLAPVFALAIDKSELAEELRMLNQRLLTSEEAGRASLATDLHDGPLQKAMLLVGGLETGLEGRQAIARHLVAELREISSRLRPAILDDLGLVPALEWLLESTANTTGIAVTFSTQEVGEEDRFPPAVELALFRVTQESVNNVVKHAQAGKVSVNLAHENGELILRVEDEGVGFESGSKGGFGLWGMRERMAQVNGTLNVRSVPGFGTSVVARLPLSKAGPTMAEARMVRDVT